MTTGTSANIAKRCKELATTLLVLMMLVNTCQIAFATDLPATADDEWQEIGQSIQDKQAAANTSENIGESENLRADVEDDETVSAASHLTLFQQVVLLELNLTGKVKSGSHAKRLSDLKEQVMEVALDDSNPSVKLLLATIMQVAPPSDELIKYIISKSTEGELKPANVGNLPFVGSTYQELALLEESVFNKTFNQMNVRSRVLKLELAVFQKSSENRDEITIAERVQKLLEAIQPSTDLIEKVATKPRSQQPGKPFAVFSFAGIGFKKVKKKTAGAIENTGSTMSKVLSSPLLWTALLGGAALYGSYLLSRSNSSGYSSSGERGCSGDRFCRVCKNCSSCRHCSIPSHPCGVFYRVRGLSY